MSLYADCYDTAPTNDLFCVLPYTQSAHLFSIRKQLHPYMVFEIGTSIRSNVQQVITVYKELLFSNNYKLYIRDYEALELADNYWDNGGTSPYIGNCSVIMNYVFHWTTSGTTAYDLMYDVYHAQYYTFHHTLHQCVCITDYEALELHPYMVFEIGTNIRSNVQQVITDYKELLFTRVGNLSSYFFI